MLTNFLLTMAGALAGGLLFFFIHTPLPWLLGPLAGVVIMAQARPGRVYWPQDLRNWGLAVLGYIMGRPFTAEVGVYILSQLPLMLAMTLAMVLFSLAAGYITHRQTGLALATSVLGTVPGGLSQMVVLGEEIAGADVAVVTVMQTIRMLAVVFCVPFLAAHGLGQDTVPPLSPFVAGQLAGGTSLAAWLPFLAAVVGGCWLAVRLNLPTAYLLGPLLATAVLAAGGLTPPPLPPLLVVAAQVLVGAYMGINMNSASLGDWRKILFYTMLNVGAVLVFSLVVAYFLAGAIPTTTVTAFLSAAPGGMAEMGIAALMLGADVSVVVGYHMFRLLFILLVLPLFLRYWLGERTGVVK